MDEFKMVPTCAIRAGDRIDLEGDPFADPNGNGVNDLGHYEAFEFELAVVNEATRESDDCIVLCTSQGEYGFPANHLLKACVVKAADIEQPDDIVFHDRWGREHLFKWVRLNPAKANYGAAWGLKGPRGSAFIIWDHGAYHRPMITACGLWSGSYPASLASVEQELASIIHTDSNRDSDDRITKAKFDSWLAID